MNNKPFYLLMRGLGQFVREFRTGILSFVTLCTLIFVYHMCCTVGVGTAGFLTHIAEVSSVRAYVSSSSKQDVSSLKAAAETIPGVKLVRYYSPVDAKNFVVENAPHLSAVKNFPEEFFPAFLELVPEEKADLDAVERAAADIPGVESVSYGKEYMSRFRMIGAGAWAFMVFISALFGISAAFTVFNTVKLSLYRFKEEIRLYSLVGATRPFIAVPYLTGAFLQSLVSYLIATALFAASFTAFNSNVLIPAGIDAFYLLPASYFTGTFVVLSLISVGAAMSGVVSFLQGISTVGND